MTPPRGHAIARVDANTIARRKIPIVFVPGVMGSRLHFPMPWYGPDRNWDPDRDAAMLRWALTPAWVMRQVLHHNAEANLIAEPEEDLEDHGFSDSEATEAIARGWGTVAWRSYGPYLLFLRNTSFGSNDCPVYVYGYDWRQDIRDTGEQLAADIIGSAVGSKQPSRFGSQGILGRENVDKCIIITHSMGGLVARAALKASGPLQNATIGALHVVQPTIGAPVLYRRFITGTVSSFVGGVGEGTVFAMILGTTGPSFTAVVSGMPGPLQLLPSDIYKNRSQFNTDHWITWRNFEDGHQELHNVNESVYNTYMRPESDEPPGIMRSDVSQAVRNDLSRRVRELRRFQQWLGDWKHARTWAIYSTALATDSTVHYDFPPRRIQYQAVPRSAPIPYGERNGERIYISQRDINWRGFKPDTEGADRGRPIRRDMQGHGDSTVPALSGSALFTQSETHDIGVNPTNWVTMRQFRCSGVSHEPAFEDTNVQQRSVNWIRYLLATMSH